MSPHVLIFIEGGIGNFIKQAFLHRAILTARSGQPDSTPGSTSRLTSISASASFTAPGVGACGAVTSAPVGWKELYGPNHSRRGFGGSVTRAGPPPDEEPSAELMLVPNLNPKRQSKPAGRITG